MPPHEEGRGLEVVEGARVRHAHQRRPGILPAEARLRRADAVRPGAARPRPELHDHGGDFLPAPPGARRGGREHFGADGPDETGEVGQIRQRRVFFSITLLSQQLIAS